jgi:acetyl-CoA carboxylase carboxyl transferase subunit beta
MSWFEKLVPSVIRTDSSEKKTTVPEGLWNKCPRCDAILFNAELVKNFSVCPKCEHHLRISARTRLDLFLDQGNRQEIGANLKPSDPLKFKDSKRYKDRISQAQKQSNETDALVVMKGTLKGEGIVAAAFDFTFMGGSMGSVVGERFVRGINESLRSNVPFIVFTASGGARMQESLFSLFQMTKTSAALTRLAEAGIPYISFMTDPTMGGVCPKNQTKIPSRKSLTTITIYWTFSLACRAFHLWMSGWFGRNNVILVLSIWVWIGWQVFLHG